MTVAIAYSAGTYGTYLEWCLTTLTSSEEIVSPFSTNGSSHNFSANRLDKFSDWIEFVESKQTADFVGIHPKGPRESLSDNLNYICNTAQSVIHLYPDRNSILLCINNWYHKPFEDWWSVRCGEYYKEIYKHWPILQDTTVQDVPNWIRREFLSFCLMSMWFDTNEWYHPDTWHHDKCCVITVDKLLYDFENTLCQIESFCKLKYVKSISELIPFHHQNLQNQRHLNEDALCAQIINSIIEPKEFSWYKLSLVSESWIQWQLRNLGYEIRCHELNEFPTNSICLKKLLYKK
jgi:hypothetical protein